MYKVSFVVDHSPALYYKAELLLFSLEHFAKQDKGNILVQCTNRVDAVFIQFLKDRNYSFKIIEPFLDGKYCNKIVQLEAFSDPESCDGFFLVDTDTFFLEPLTPPHLKSFCAKTVDGANPPIVVLEKIYDAAKLTYPKLVGTDWHPSEKTFATNFNGGYYYIPKNNLEAISKGWKKWATWLYERPNLFETKSQYIHVDQVAIGMAIVEKNIEYSNIASNFNCPIHSSENQQYFERNEPVQMLHYHGALNVFGQLERAFAGNSKIMAAIEQANTAIANHAPFVFYKGYRRSQVKALSFTEKTKYLHSELLSLKAMHKNGLKLIIHGGSPKTGTTSLQFFLHQNNPQLLRSGFIYPDVYIDTYAPKHQWLMRALLTADAEMLIVNFKTIFSQLKSDTHTIILSTEGIYNHWTDFSQEAKSFLRVLSQIFPTEFWVWLREPASFLKSLYRQYLKNPKNEVACYGQDMSLSEMMNDNWFISHFDYLGFIYDLESIIEGKNINTFKHQGDIVTSMRKLLNLNTDVQINERENIGLGDSTVELLRIINRFPLSEAEKDECVNLLAKIDKILISSPQQRTDDGKAIFDLNILVALQKNTLETDYGLLF